MNSHKRPTVGLALGSGSARGFAHIGVLQALHELHVPIDLVCGCSMGAIIGAVYCSGADMQLFQKLCGSVNARDFMDVAIPRRGLLRGERFESLIKLLTKERTFEEMDIPFACVACDIAAGKTKLFDTGKVYEAVRASMSIPGVFEPKWINGVMYVDGGVLDAVPADFTRQMGADVVIAVDVGIHKAEPAKVNDSLWSVFMRTLDLTGYEACRHKLNDADILISPNLGNTAEFSNEDVDRCVEIGYHAAMAHRDLLIAVSKLEKLPEQQPMLQQAMS